MFRFFARLAVQRRYGPVDGGVHLRQLSRVEWRRPAARRRRALARAKANE